MIILTKSALREACRRQRIDLRKLTEANGQLADELAFSHEMEDGHHLQILELSSQVTSQRSQIDLLRAENEHLRGLA